VAASHAFRRSRISSEVRMYSKTALSYTISTGRSACSLLFGLCRLTAAYVAVPSSFPNHARPNRWARSLFWTALQDELWWTNDQPGLNFLE